MEWWSCSLNSLGVTGSQWFLWSWSWPPSSTSLPSIHARPLHLRYVLSIHGCCSCGYSGNRAGCCVDMGSMTFSRATSSHRGICIPKAQYPSTAQNSSTSTSHPSYGTTPKIFITKLRQSPTRRPLALDLPSARSC